MKGSDKVQQELGLSSNDRMTWSILSLIYLSYGNRHEEM